MANAFPTDSPRPSHEAAGEHSESQQSGQHVRHRKRVQCEQCSEMFVRSTVICPRCARMNSRSPYVIACKFLVVVAAVLAVIWVMNVVLDFGSRPNDHGSHIVQPPPGGTGTNDVRF